MLNLLKYLYFVVMMIVRRIISWFKMYYYAIASLLLARDLKLVFFSFFIIFYVILFFKFNYFQLFDVAYCDTGDVSSDETNQKEVKSSSLVLSTKQKVILVVVLCAFGFILFATGFRFGFSAGTVLEVVKNGRQILEEKAHLEYGPSANIEWVDFFNSNITYDADEVPTDLPIEEIDKLQEKFDDLLSSHNMKTKS